MKITFSLLLVVLSFQVKAQIIESGDFEQRINDIISSMPGNSGNNYTLPDLQQSDDWVVMINNILNGYYSEAANNAALLDYQLVLFTDTTIATDNIFYLLEKTSQSTNYWGTYSFKPDACRQDLVIQSPHPKYDLNTGKQGAYIYKHVDAGAFFLAGAHRCNQSNLTNCSGSTSACSGTSEPYRKSDMAHNTDSPFHLTTELLSDYNPNSVFVQLHGFSKLSTDPYAIISNGTRVTPDPDYISLIADELYNVDNILTFKIVHIDLTWSRLIAFSNTQGRYINQSSNACSSNATTSEGRFIHIEQEKTRLRLDSDKWEKMRIALSNVFQCDSTTATQNRFLSDNGIEIFIDTYSEKIIIKNSEYLLPGNFVIFDQLGRKINEVHITDNFETIDTKNLSPGIYFYHLTNSKTIIMSGKILLR